MFRRTIKKILAKRFPRIYEIMVYSLNLKRKKSSPRIGNVTFSRKSQVSRINLVLPPTGSSDVFGGVASAFSLLGGLIEPEVRVRVLFEDKCPSTDDVCAMLKKYAGDVKYSSLEIALVGDKHEIAIEPLDRFIVTSWRTAFIFQKIFDNHKNNEGFSKFPLIYLVQDYEPGFYAWSSEFALAMSTYQWTGPIIYLFNSFELADYFVISHGDPTASHVFPPIFNQALKTEISIQKNSIALKEKTIVVYGRPMTPRNGFNLCVEALVLWAKKYHASAEWKVISVGESHPDYDIGSGIKIKSVGKLSIRHYAELMLKSSVGLSVMISPHPSYPPLEMAVCGMNVVTNNFGPKKLDGKAPNIFPVDELKPDKIAEKLIKLCESYQADKKTVVNYDIMEGSESFDEVILNLKRDLFL